MPAYHKNALMLTDILKWKAIRLWPPRITNRGQQPMQFCKPKWKLRMAMQAASFQCSYSSVAVISVCQSDQRMLESLSCHLQRCITAEYIPGSRDNKRTLKKAGPPAAQATPRPRQIFTFKSWAEQFCHLYILEMQLHILVLTMKRWTVLYIMEESWPLFSLYPFTDKEAKQHTTPAYLMTTPLPFKERSSVNV